MSKSTQLIVVILFTCVVFPAGAQQEPRAIPEEKMIPLLLPPVSSYVKYFGPMSAPESNLYYLVPTCERQVVNWNNKRVNYEGSIQFWSLDGKRLMYVDDSLPVSGEKDRKRYRFETSLDCSPGAEKSNGQSFPRIPPRKLSDDEKIHEWDQHIWGECRGEKKRKGTFDTVVPGVPILEYHQDKSKESPILWQVDLAKWPFPNGSHLTCTTWQDLFVFEPLISRGM
jgi:hypothetical protein